MSSHSSCQAYDATKQSPYGYDPSLSAGVAFCVLFGLSMLGHMWYTIRTREWWLSVFVVGTLCELIGWIGRAVGHDCPYSKVLFEMQLASLILAPNFFTAGCYIIFGRLIALLGPHYSPLSAKTYLYIFCGSDLLSLVIQGIGGGKAAAAFATNPPGNTKPGTNIMVAGIIFQLASITVFAFLFTTVLTRARIPLAKISIMQKVLVAATVFSLTLIYIRSVYRTIELLQGWRGYLLITERYFIALDGSMMILAVAIFNFVNPSFGLASSEEKMANGSTSRGGDIIDSPRESKGTT